MAEMQRDHAREIGRAARPAPAVALRTLARPPIAALMALSIIGASATAWLVTAVRSDIAGRLVPPAAVEAEAEQETAFEADGGDVSVAADAREYFPASGSVIWHDDPYLDLDSLSYGGFADASAELAIADMGRGYNHMLRLRRGGRLVMSVHLAEGGRARVDLPLGTYGVELVSRPVGANYETAFAPRARGRFVRSIHVGRPASHYRLSPMLMLTDRRQATFIRGVRASQVAF